MNIGEKLFELRKSQNLSQEEAANKLNVTRQTISKWETNQSTPDFDKIVPICELYGITTDELLTGERHSSPAGDDADITRDDLLKNKKKTALVLSVSIFIYFLSICWIIFADENLRINDGLIVCIFLLICAFATVLIVYHFVSIPRYIEEKSVEETEKEKKIKHITKIISLVFTIVYLLISFLTMAWHITWIIWIVYAITEEIVKLIFEYMEDKKENE